MRGFILTRSPRSALSDVADEAVGAEELSGTHTWGEEEVKQGVTASRERHGFKCHRNAQTCTGGQGTKLLAGRHPKRDSLFRTPRGEA